MSYRKRSYDRSRLRDDHSLNDDDDEKDLVQHKL